MAPIAAASAAPSGRVLSVRGSLLAMLGLCCVCVLVRIDQTVVGTAFLTIVDALNGFELYAWAATAYLLTSVINLAVLGRRGNYSGRKPIDVESVGVFNIVLVLCDILGTLIRRS